MTAFIAEEGMVRLCTEDYSKPTQENLHNLLSHLTNYSLNKLSNKYIHTEDMNEQAIGSKQTLT
jgi:Tubulin-tyrosine ligase family